ncbi:hypothetical protein B9Z55_025557 [Caenorhabditis nigoni]|uniref:Uncharacterized protein n=1 Tax=Caenorhabditis nigoni TaxID=1611254 RepID=A0A2G5SZE1_9PELO|nr:hypothetical protein B9Z55_025557 [Caenorhabditis nigoni]
MDYGSILEERTSPAVLANAREQYLRQCARGEPSAGSTFAYAHAMIGSKNKLDVKDGILCLESEYSTTPQHQSDSSPSPVEAENPLDALKLAGFFAFCMG